MKNNIARSTDMVARYGGEEFIAVLTETDIEGSKAVAERLRSNVEALKIPHEKSSVSSYVTISLGCASIVPTDDLDSDFLIQKADEALYQSKTQGRNRVSVQEIS